MLMFMLSTGLFISQLYSLYRPLIAMLHIWERDPLPQLQDVGEIVTPAGWHYRVSYASELIFAFEASKQV